MSNYFYAVPFNMQHLSSLYMFNKIDFLHIRLFVQQKLEMAQNKRQSPKVSKSICCLPHIWIVNSSKCRLMTATSSSLLAAWWHNGCLLLIIILLLWTSHSWISGVFLFVSLPICVAHITADLVLCSFNIFSLNANIFRVS